MTDLLTCLNGLDAAALYCPAGAPLLSMQRIPAGRAVCRSGEPVEAMLLLVRGRLNVRALSAQGQYGSISHARPPHLIGDLELLQHRPFLHTVVAETEALFVRFPLDYVQRHLLQEPAFYRFLCLHLANKLYATSLFYSRTLTEPAIHRFAAWLLARAQEDGAVRVVGVQAAEDLGVTPRHISRMLRTLTDSGTLVRSGAKCFRIADRPALCRAAQSL